MDTLIQYISRILAWALQAVDWVLIEVFGVVCTALGNILSAIPVPSWMSGASSQLGALPAGVLYFAQVMDFSFGLTVVASAYGIRFLIRRIPVIG